MNGRAERLGRLLSIRRLNEDLDRRALQLALAAMADVQAGISRQEATLVEANIAAQIALLQGGRAEWLMAEAQSEVAGWNRRNLRTLLLKRAAEAGEATQKFTASRREHQQVAQLVEDARHIERIEEQRRAQANADDWFLSKLPRNLEGEL